MQTLNEHDMKYIVIPEQPKERMTPAFYFAVEEYVANHFTDDEYFFVCCTNFRYGVKAKAFHH